MKPVIERIPEDAQFCRLSAADPAMGELLRRAGLPTSDLEGKDKLYIGLVNDDRLSAAGGIERCGCHGLARSLVVAESQRGRGLGRSLADQLIRQARSMGLEELYIITNTANGFFARLGFAAIRRDEAPQEIMLTRQFAELCPASASVMRLKL
jgi:amino-acid N-acetyltransferase